MLLLVAAVPSPRNSEHLVESMLGPADPLRVWVHCLPSHEAGKADDTTPESLVHYRVNWPTSWREGQAGSIGEGRARHLAESPPPYFSPGLGEGVGTWVDLDGPTKMTIPAKLCACATSSGPPSNSFLNMCIASQRQLFRHPTALCRHRGLRAARKLSRCAPSCEPSS